MNKEQILYEDKDIIVCYKPAGIATQTARIGQRDMVSEVTNYLAARVALVHRLDQPVEGILVFGKTQKAGAGLSRQITENRMEKFYYAVVSDNGPASKEEVKAETKLESKPGNAHRVVLTDYLLKDNKTNTSRVVSSESAGAKKAVLEYEILERKELFSKDLPETTSNEEKPTIVALARIRLITGRHHQIRVQMSHAGMSLLGDCKYADEETRSLSDKLRLKQVALCAYRLDFRHPATGKKMSFQKAPEGGIFQNFSI